MPTALRDVRFRGQSGKHMLAWIFSGFDPGCVKTYTSGECAELFSLFSSFDGDRQSGSFLIERNRDKLSTRRFDVGVFTQAGPVADISADGDQVRLSRGLSRSTGRTRLRADGHRSLQNLA